MKNKPQSKDQSSTHLLTPKQVCDRLQISTRTLGRYIHENRIPFVKLKGLYRFKENSIVNYLFEQETLSSPKRETTDTLSRSTHQVQTTVEWWLSVHRHTGEFCMSMVRSGLLSRNDSDELQRKLKDIDKILLSLKSQSVSLQRSGS
jgi:excisionase family DNA binding protein